MAKTSTKNKSKNSAVRKKVSNTNKKVVTGKKDNKKKKYVEHEQHNKRTKIIVSLVLIGILLIVSTYAWFSTSLNVKVKTFNMIVTKNSGLSISFDAINYDSFIEISEDTLINNLGKTYPNNLSQWTINGLTPVSSPGITNPNDYKFDIYASGGVRYRNKKKENGFITTVKQNENSVSAYNNYIAFDVFLKNDTGSPIDDNLYLDTGTEVVMDSDSSEEMEGLVNSVRIGFVKVGSVPLNTNATAIQSLGCKNDCKSIIFEPNSLGHTNMSMERSQKYGINLKEGQSFPTYACKKAGGPIMVADTVSGSANLDSNYFELQNTITEADFSTPLFSIPNGITKMRVYVWIEGQDIDSLETDSDGADISISINFVKDTRGYTSFN